MLTMSEPNTAVTVVQREPGRSRRPVLAEPAEDVAKKLKDNPGKWHLIASGGWDRRGVFSQTAYRIRQGTTKGFERTDAGTFETQVSTDTTVAERTAPVELFARWLEA